MGILTSLYSVEAEKLKTTFPKLIYSQDFWM